MRIYISGPMSGIRDHNFPAFHAEAKRLRELGYDVVNPAELHDGETHHPHCFYMRTDIALVTTVEAIVLLDGWEKSLGACAEMHVAMVCGVGVFHEGENP